MTAPRRAAAVACLVAACIPAVLAASGATAADPADWRALCADPRDRAGLETCEDAVAASGEPEAGRQFASLLLRHGDEPRAITVLDGLAARYPDDAAIQFDYAAALATLHNYAAAAGPITAALRLGRRDIAGNRLAAIVYEHLARPEEAFVFHYRLARLGDRIGMVDLAWDYAVGRGIGADLEAAVHWYEQAAALGHVGAMLALAEAHRTGDLGLPADPERAKAWDERAAAERAGD